MFSLKDILEKIQLQESLQRKEVILIRMRVFFI